MNKILNKILLNKILKNENFNYFETDYFVNFYNKNYIIENQGWKIHISAIKENYLEIFKKVLFFCIENNLSLKFIKNKKDFFNNISKNGNRITSGKFITIYPKNENNFVDAINKLNILLKGYFGPYILTDIQYKKNKVLYYRYGSNSPDQENYIICPDGSKIIDRNIPYKLPHFINDPFTNTKKNNVNIISNIFLKNNRYKILGKLHISNGGGIYYALDNQTNKNVLIKEARPYIGFDNEYSMINLRKNEIRFLKLLKKYDFVPNYIDCFYEDTHFFVVREFIRSWDLNLESINYHFFLYEKSDLLNLLNNFQSFIKDFLKLIIFLHKKNIIINDFSKYNFLINNNKKIFFIDFDNSFLLTDSDKKKYKISGTYVKNWRWLNLKPKRLDFHKFGFLLLDIICFGVNYFNKRNKGKKDIYFLKNMLRYYELPSWVFYLIYDLIYNKNFDINNLQLYFNNDKFKKFKFFSSITKIKKIYFNLLNLIKNENNFLLKYIDSSCLKNIILNKNFILNINNNLIDLLIICDFEKWNNLFFLYEYTFAYKEIPKNLENVSIFDLYKYIIFNIFNYNFTKLEIFKINFEKIIDYIFSNKLKKFKNKYYIDNKKFMSPNFENGIMGFIYILIIYSKCMSIKIYDDKIKKMLHFSNFNFIKKIDFYTGISGIGYVYLIAYDYFKENIYLKYSMDKTFMIDFNSIIKNKKIQFINQNGEVLNNDFKNGNYGIYFFIKKLLNLINCN